MRLLEFSEPPLGRHVSEPCLPILEAYLGRFYRLPCGARGVIFSRLYLEISVSFLSHCPGSFEPVSDGERAPRTRGRGGSRPRSQPPLLPPRIADDRWPASSWYVGGAFWLRADYGPDSHRPPRQLGDSPPSVRYWVGA